MRRRTIRCLALTGLLAGVAPPFVGAAPETSTTTQSIQLELADLNESLDELVALLRSHLEGQRFELMVQRMDVVQRGLAVKERELEDLREQRASLKAEVEQTQTRLDTVGEDPAQLGISEEQVDGVLAEWERQLKVMADQVWRLDQRIITLESQVTRQREDLRAWEKAVDEELQ